MIIYHHLGLGDHLICNGLVRHFAQEQKIILLCKYHNFTNINFMYKDNSNITVLPVTDDQEAETVCRSKECLRCGFAVGGRYYNGYLWDEMFYLDANIPFEYSWTNFFCNRNTYAEQLLYNKLTNNEPYIFIHNTDSTGINRIDENIIQNTNIKYIIAEKNIPIFNYLTIIEKASEIHCINSSFRHLIDRVPTVGKLYYHIKKQPRAYDIFNSKKYWNIV